VDQDPRSIRLLAEAEKLATSGKYVMVVCTNFPHARSMAQQFVQRYGGHGMEVNPKIDYKSGWVSFETPELLNWETMTFPWASVDAVLLIDPSTIEERYRMTAKVREALHRFD